MRCLKGASLVLVVLMVGVAQASTQPPRQTPGGGPQDRGPFKWWQNDKFKAELGLTSDQSRRMEDIFHTTQPKLRTCFGDLDQLERKLSDMIYSEATEADVRKQIDIVEASRSKMSKTRTLMLYRIRQVLTPEQRSRLKAMFDSFDAERRRQPRRER
jgi:Spy/CpxP family protein refolding chaperone